MSGRESARRGLAVVSSGALVVGAGAAVGVLAADMAAQWTQDAALEQAAQVVAEQASDVAVPRPVVVTRIEERHVTPDPVVVHRKVYLRVPVRQGSSPGARAPKARTAPQRQPARSSPAQKPSRTVVAPAPAPQAPAPSAPKATSTTS
jgi:hypothetical protein